MLEFTFSLRMFFPEEIKLLIMELLYLSMWNDDYITCMKDWCAFSLSCAICAWSAFSEGLLELTEDLQSSLEISEKWELLLRGKGVGQS